MKAFDKSLDSAAPFIDAPPAQGLITERQLVEWATVILHNHAYELDGEDEHLIASWLNDISFDLNPSVD